MRGEGAVSRAIGKRITATILAVVMAAPAHLLADPVAAAEQSLAIDVSWTRPGSSTVLRHPSMVRVGDTMTIGFVTNGLIRAGCGASIQALPSGATMGVNQMLANTDGCDAWTFVIPPTPSIGTLFITAGAEGYRDPDDIDGVTLDPVELTLSMEAGGSWRPFTTNFPHLSWAPIDFLGSTEASFGVPITFAAAPGATRGCRYAFSGDWGNALEVRPLDYETCPSWDVTIPDLRPEPFRAGDLAAPMRSTFVSESGRYDATLDRYIAGSMSTELDWSPTAGNGPFATSLPAVTWPEATTPRYAVVGQPVNLAPRIDSTPDGSYCRLNYSTPDMGPGEVVELEQPVSGGACAGVNVTPTTTGTLGVFVQLHRADREPLGWSNAAVEIIEPMPPPVVVAPPTVVEGDPVTVTGSVGTGVPMAYDISLAPSTSATSAMQGLTAAAGTCAAGSLDPRLEQSSATATCTAGNPGSYKVAVRFTDVTGATKTTTRTVNVVDAVQRLAGADRYATAATVSAKSFAAGAPVAYVATGASFPDALAAGPVAARDRGPVLLVKAGSVPAATMSELKRLKPKKIVVLGGTSVIAQSVATTLGSVAPVTRIAGVDRYDTAARLSRTFTAGVPVAYVAIGTNFPDALAGVPATRGRGPLLLVSPAGIPSSVKQELLRLKPREIVVLGGTAAVSPATVAALDAYTTGSVPRRAGANRYETSVAVSKGAFSTASVAYLAVGTNFPDALAGGPPAAIAGAPILLVARDTLPASVRSELVRLGVQRVVVLGGTGSISAKVIAQLGALLE